MSQSFDQGTFDAASRASAVAARARATAVEMMAQHMREDHRSGLRHIADRLGTTIKRVKELLNEEEVNV